MGDFVGTLLRLVGFRRVPPDTEIVVSGESDKPAIRVPSFASAADAEEARDITKKREEIAERSKKTVEHMLGATVAAAEIQKVRRRTTIELTKLDVELEDAVALKELNKELRPEREQVLRQQVSVQVSEANAAAAKAAAKAKVADLEAKRIIHDALETFAVPPPQDPAVVAEEKSRAEQEVEEKEWALNVVLDIASWTYPAMDDEGYSAYAACHYFAARLDEGKSHDEAVEIALEQLLRRKQLRGAFPTKDAEQMAGRAKAMWTKWKAHMTTERTEAQKRKTADTVFDAARMQREAAERLHDVINGGETNEDFDATK